VKMPESKKEVMPNDWTRGKSEWSPVKAGVVMWQSELIWVPPKTVGGGSAVKSLSEKKTRESRK